MDAWPQPPRSGRLDWLASAGVHALVIVLLGLTFRPEPKSIVETPREVQIVARPRLTKAEFFAEAVDAKAAVDSPSSIASAPAADPSADSAAPAPGGRPLIGAAASKAGEHRTAWRPVDLAAALPGGKDSAPPTSVLPGPNFGVGFEGLTFGARRAVDDTKPRVIEQHGPLANGPAWTRTGSPAEVRIFGQRGQGHAFVFVVDRSASMGSGNRYVLEAAKQELVAAIAGLQDNHRFQLVFYNERVESFVPSNKPWPEATAAHKQRALNFIRGVVPAGQTKHFLAIAEGLRLEPDVLFVLTDAQEPALTPGERATLKRLNRGATIHTVEFGFGKLPDGVNSLQRLAAENRGQHRYIDLNGPLTRGGGK